MWGQDYLLHLKRTSYEVREAEASKHRLSSTKTPAMMNVPNNRTNNKGEILQTDRASVGSSKPLKQKRLCWNCRKTGHVYSHCPQPRKKFCQMCGRRGYTAKTCPNCGETWRKMGPYVPKFGKNIRRCSLKYQKKPADDCHSRTKCAKVASLCSTYRSRDESTDCYQRHRERDESIQHYPYRRSHKNSSRREDYRRHYSDSRDMHGTSSGHSR